MAHVGKKSAFRLIGKVGDFLRFTQFVLDRNPLKIPAEDIANVQVLETVVGGRTVYERSADRR